MYIASVIESLFFAVVQRIMKRIFSCEIIETLKLMWPLLAEEKNEVLHCKDVGCRQLCLCIPGEFFLPYKHNYQL